MYEIISVCCIGFTLVMVTYFITNFVFEVKEVYSENKKIRKEMTEVYEKTVELEKKFEKFDNKIFELEKQVKKLEPQEKSISGNDYEM